MKNIAILLSTVLLILTACSKSNSTTTNLVPTNLMVNAVVATDTSGNVAFTAAATNAVSYDYDFGNGVFQAAASGIVTYKYPVSGTYSVNVIAKSSTGQTVSTAIQVTVTVKLSLVWSDEFDTPGPPNAAKWNYDIGTGSGGWGNNELEYYTNRQSNVVISNGTLKINAIKENYSGSSYTSARILTQNNFAFKYGRIEIRAKLPAGLGTWPAIWMLGSNINTTSWPDCGEMDIMEQKGSELNKIYATLHYPGHSGANGNGNTLVIANSSTAFHSYIMEWSAASIKFYVDDQLFHTVANTSSLPFNQNFFIILNFAIGGNFGGTVDPAFTNATMEVDYVRVYQ